MVVSRLRAFRTSLELIKLLKARARAIDEAIPPKHLIADEGALHLGHGVARQRLDPEGGPWAFGGGQRAGGGVAPIAPALGPALDGRDDALAPVLGRDADDRDDSRLHG